MSRIGKKPITIPKGVTVTIKDRELEVKGTHQITPSGDMLRLQVRAAGLPFDGDLSAGFARVGLQSLLKTMRPSGRLGFTGDAPRQQHALHRVQPTMTPRLHVTRHVMAEQPVIQERLVLLVGEVGLHG